MIYFAENSKKHFDIYIDVESKLLIDCKSKKITSGELSIGIIYLYKYEINEGYLYEAKVIYSNNCIGPDANWFIQYGLMKELFDIDIYPCYVAKEIFNSFDLYCLDKSNITLPSKLKFFREENDTIDRIYLVKPAKISKGKPLIITYNNRVL